MSQEEKQRWQEFDEQLAAAERQLRAAHLLDVDMYSPETQPWAIDAFIRANPRLSAAHSGFPWPDEVRRQRRSLI